MKAIYRYWATGLILFPIVAITMLMGCDNSKLEPTSSISNDTTPVINSTSPSLTSPSQTTMIPPTQPISVEVTFPNGAPSLNQEAELSCIIKARTISLENVKIEVRLPEALKLMSGSLTWSGNISEGDEFQAIDATVRSVRTGNWSIELRNSMNPQKQRSFSFYADWQPVIYISISENSSQWGKTPPWIGPPTTVLPTNI